LSLLWRWLSFMSRTSLGQATPRSCHEPVPERRDSFFAA
jgi:hypothetical protein